MMRSISKSKKALLCCALGAVLADAASGAVFTSTLVTNLPAVPGLPFGSSPSGGAVMGGYYYFAASDGPDGTTGTELWRTDGTSNGTTLVKDIWPGAASSNPQFLTASGTNLFFVANDGVHGNELWKSDGTAAGTVMVADMTPGPGSSQIQGLEPVGNSGLCFNVPTNLQYETEYILYRSDGTANGTFVVAGPRGVSTGYSGQYQTSGSDILFISVDSLYPNPLTNSLWRFTGNGPYQAYKLVTSTNYLTYPNLLGTECFYAMGTNFTVIANNQTNRETEQFLFRVNNTGGTPQLLDSTMPNYMSGFDGMVVTNNYLFYYSDMTDSSFDGTTTYGPWRAVSPAGSPVTIEPDSSVLQGIIAVIGGYVYYTIQDPTTFDIIASRTPGNSAGAQQLNFTSYGFSPYEFEQAGTRVFFADSSGLGTTDFTPAGTQRISNSIPANGQFSGLLGTLGSIGLYAANDAVYGLEPYRSDGTTNGTYLLRDIAPGYNTPAPQAAVASGGLYYFALNTPGLGVELWKSDGTPAGTGLVKDIYSGTNSSSPSQLTAWNGLVFFAANNGTNGTELWRSDGTAAGTYMVKDIRAGATGSNPYLLTPTGSQVFFVADDGSHGAELWRTDGTSNGTYLVQDIVPGIGSANIRSMGAAGGLVYFTAGPTNTSSQLWFSDGTSGGTQFLVDFGSISDSNSLPNNFTTFGGRVYFTIEGIVTYVTDGTPSGTVLFSSNAGSQLAVAGSNLFITSQSALWVSDGTVAGTVALTNLTSTNLIFPDVPSQLTTVVSNVYFAFGSELWSSDGTTNGTALAADWSGPDLNPNCLNMTPFRGTLAFSSSAPLLGRELWSIAPGQGPALIEDLSPQAGNDGVLFDSPATNQIFYLAKPDGQSSWEVRTLQLQSLAPPPSAPYGGTPWPIPGHIEVENFDTGGNSQAYYDLTADNEGGQYRPYEGVDIESCDDTNGGYCVFDTQAGEWLKYTVNVAVSGLYEVDIRETSTAVDTGYYRLEVDGVDTLEGAAFNNGTPGSWFTFSVADVAIPAGIHTLRLYFESDTSAGDAGVYNWMNFTLEETNQPPVVTMQFPPNGSIISTDQVVTVSASVVDPTTGFPPTVQFFIDGQSLGTTSAPPASIVWQPTPGPHTIYAIATDSFGVSSASQTNLFFVTEPTLILSGASWRADVAGTNVGTLWRRTNFDDSKWPTGRTPFGFGYAGLRTLTPSNFNGSPIPTFYFRHTISNDFTGVNYASITLTRDDAAVVYINGQELARENLPLPPTNIVFTNLALINVVNNATHTNAAQDIIPVPMSMLQNGSNVIAVEIHQGRPSPIDNFDMKFDLTFSTYSYTPSPMLNIAAGPNNAVTLSWPDSIAGWMLLQSSDLSTWDPANGTVIDTNGFFNLTLPAINKQFFRLQQTNGP